MNILSKALVTALILAPTLSQASTSIYCAVVGAGLGSNSIGVTLNENSHSDYVTLVGNKMGQGTFTASHVDYFNTESTQGRLISLKNDKTGVTMDVYSDDFAQYTPGMYTGEARISVGEVQSSATTEKTYCTIIVDHKEK